MIQNTENEIILKGIELTDDVSELDFYRSVKQIKILECKIRTKLNFTGFDNLKSVSIEQCTFINDGNIRFYNCEIAHFYAKECIVDQSIDDSSQFEFSSIVFNHFYVDRSKLIKMSFLLCEFKKVNAVIKSSAQRITYRGCKFCGNIILNTIREEGCEIKFASSNFSSTFNVMGCNINKLVLKEGSFLSDASLIVSETEIFSLVLSSLAIHGMVVLSSSSAQYNRVSIRNCIVSGGIRLKMKQITTEPSVESINCLKHEAIKRNDFITARELHRLEMNAHKKYILKRIKDAFAKKTSKKYTVSFKSHINQMLIHYNNQISNNYGTSWLRGVLYTLGVTGLFTSLIYWHLLYEGIVVWDWSYSGVIFFLSGCMDVLNIINYRDVINGIELPLFGRALHFAGRIFIAYGVYQVVSAFRSYGRKA